MLTRKRRSSLSLRVCVRVCVPPHEQVRRHHSASWQCLGWQLPSLSCRENKEWVWIRCSKGWVPEKLSLQVSDLPCDIR